MTPLAATLDPDGPAARAAADLWWLMLALGVVVFAVFAALLVGGLLRHRRDDPVDTESGGNRLVGAWIVAGGVAMPLLVIVVVFVATLQAMRATPTTAAPDALRIEVVGHQFWYEVRYPDDGVVTANEVHLPVGRDVELELISADVIHSFWVPALGGKLDMLPDHANTLVIRADEPGEHRSQCAEFCGLQHARMGLVVVAEPADAFADWVAEQRAAATRGVGEVSRRGRDVFVEAGCAECHAAPGVEAVAAPAAEGPVLGDLPTRRTLGAATLPNTRENAADWIRNPQAIKPGVEMPATPLTDEELEALLTYLGYPR